VDDDNAVERGTCRADPSAAFDEANDLSFAKTAGLLIACDAVHAEAIVQRIVDDGYPFARIIGQVEISAPAAQTGGLIRAARGAGNIHLARHVVQSRAIGVPSAG
jgi:hypothetical protein